MRKAFQSFYPPSEQFFDSLWKDSLIVLDTNVLLDLYRYSDDTRSDFLALFGKISDRLWIPHQVGLEFSRRRPSVIAEQVQMFQKATGLIASLRDSTAKEIEKILSFRLHPVLSKDEFKKAFEDPLAELEQKIGEYTKSHPDFLRDDPILESLLKLLEGRVGPAFSETRLEEVFKEGKKRYEKNIPPGYEDSRGPNKKEGDGVYGDLVLWLQIIDHVKESKLPGVIFVSNDMKEDWWWISKGRNLGCRPELREEMYSKTGANFHIYTSERFLHYAPNRIEIKVREESIDEVRTLEKKNREANEKAAGSFANAVIESYFQKKAEENQRLFNVEQSNILALAEERRKQEAFNQVLKPSFKRSAAWRAAVEQMSKLQLDREAEFERLRGILGLQRSNSPLGTILGLIADPRDVTDDAQTLDETSGAEYDNVTKTTSEEA